MRYLVAAVLALAGVQCAAQAPKVPGLDCNPKIIALYEAGAEAKFTSVDLRAKRTADGADFLDDGISHGQSSRSSSGVQMIGAL